MRSDAPQLSLNCLGAWWAVPDYAATAKKYAELAARATDPDIAEAYRNLARGYELLAHGTELLRQHNPLPDEG